MIDVVDAATRSKMMSGIRSKNTSPELFIRKSLHARGVRFRIHAKHLPGTPDLVFPKYKAAIFVHGCFWHGHSCRYFKVPKTRSEFWLEKIAKNKARDFLHQRILIQEGWRVLVVWECAIRLMSKQGHLVPINSIVEWLKEGSGFSYEMAENCIMQRLDF